MEAPTLYLDFDGVLHPGSAQPEERFSRRQLLIEALDGFELNIVVSSSWRFHYTLDRIRSLLGLSLGARVTDITGEAVMGAYSRWREIERHAMFERIRNFKALDDSEYLFPPDCGALILCDGSRGIGEAQAKDLRRWLEASATPRN